MLVHQDLPAVEIDLGNFAPGTEAIACEISFQGTTVLVALIYSPPMVELDVRLLERLAQHNQVLVLGDFNARHPALGCVGTNPQRRAAC